MLPPRSGSVIGHWWIDHFHSLTFTLSLPTLVVITTFFSPLVGYSSLSGAQSVGVGDKKYWQRLYCVVLLLQSVPVEQENKHFKLGEDYPCPAETLFVNIWGLVSKMICIWRVYFSLGLSYYIACPLVSLEGKGGFQVSIVFRISVALKIIASSRPVPPPPKNKWNRRFCLGIPRDLSTNINDWIDGWWRQDLSKENEIWRPP